MVKTLKSLSVRARFKMAATNLTCRGRRNRPTPIRAVPSMFAVPEKSAVQIGTMSIFGTGPAMAECLVCDT
jgi:hypothetical protein